MNTIKLYQTTDGWMALFSDPKVKEVMGTDLLPTAFTAQADESLVLNTLRAKNPNEEVKIAHRLFG